MYYASALDRRRQRIRRKLSTVSTDRPRLVVNRTNKHTYAQVIDTNSGKVLVNYSTNMKIASDVKNGANVAAAKIVGENIGKQAVKAGIKKVVFDRSGFLYHGRIKAIAEAAREAGLDF